MNLPNVVRSTLAETKFKQVETGVMNIGQAAQTSGVSAKMIRYYEAIGLSPRAARSGGGYRHYGQADVQRLCFIRRARDLGFPLDRIRDLLKLWSDRERHSADVKAVALAHIGELETRAAELNGMIKTLRHLVRACEGDERPDCPIIDELGAGAGVSGGILDKPTLGPTVRHRKPRRAGGPRSA